MNPPGQNPTHEDQDRVEIRFREKSRGRPQATGPAAATDTAPTTPTMTGSIRLRDYPGNSRTAVICAIRARA
jgi:hypothetical protein